MGEFKPLDNEFMSLLTEQIHAIRQEVVDIRRYLHMHPEIGFDTQNTERVVREFLTGEGIEIIPGQMGVQAVIHGKSDKLIALRADMDALCLQEENEVPYKSEYANKMHACGHDGHTAMLLGAAKILQANKERLPLSVLLIFQPAEEGPNLGGARVILADLQRKGIADRIVGVFGQHLFNDFELGKVGYRVGSLMSSTDEFDIKIIGRGGHAGQPHEAIDALSVGSHFVTTMESFMSRRKNPFDPGVFSVGIFQSGSAKNIVSETAVIAGTIRCQSEETRAFILENMERILKSTCEAFGATYTLDVLHGLPVLRNDKAATAYAESVTRMAAGDENTFEIPEPMMGAEDFAYYAEKIPASFLFIGSRNEAKGFSHLNHHPQFDFDEDALLVGIREMCCLAFCAKAIEQGLK